MIKMLIVDDDMHLRKLILTYGELEGYICKEAENAEQALALATAITFDIIILDVMMPGMDGFETLASIRSNSQVPVIMLTARNEEYDKLFGFNLGADDYLAKPFSPKELMARVRAVLKRTGGKQSDLLKYGGLIISAESRTVILSDQLLSLTPKEFDLLFVLAQNIHIVLTREQILEKVWGYDYYGDARTVDTHIKSLREHLGEYRNIIQTVWGVGYKFEYK